MSAPDTNIERQKDRHKPSLLGIRGAMIWGALMLIGLIFFATLQGPAPMGSDVTIDPAVPGTNVSN